MMNRLRSCGVALVIGLAAAYSVAADERDGLQASCWQPSALAAKPGERTPLRSTGAAAIRVPNPADAGDASGASTAPAGVVRSVALPAGKKLIALTFDLCETAGETARYDGAIIDYLPVQRIKATLFAGGHW